MQTCIVPPSAGGEGHNLFVGLLIVTALVAFAVISWSVRDGKPGRAAVASFLTSPVATTIVAVTWESRSLWHLLNPTIQAPAFEFGDSLLLPPIFALGAIVWCSISPDSRWRGWIWWVAALVLGGAFAFWFHHNEVGVYGPLRLNSPSKLAHDIVAEGGLAAALVYVLVPVLWVLMRRWRELSRRTRLMAAGATSPNKEFINVI